MFSAITTDLKTAIFKNRNLLRKYQIYSLIKLTRIVTEDVAFQNFWYKLLNNISKLFPISVCSRGIKMRK